jgi:hypothetical protein
MSAGGFQVVIPDLQQAAGVFHSESATFKAIMPSGGPPCPDGGSAAFDGALHSAVQLLSLLHLQMSAVIDQHGTKLQIAHDNYAKTEIGLTNLAHEITPGGGQV